MNIIDHAAAQAIESMNSEKVRLTGIRQAKHVCSILDRRTYLHAGPPIDAADVSGPLRGSLIAALIFEGEATSLTDAERIISNGHLHLAPCHDHGAVAAAAGVVSPSMPVVVCQGSSGGVAFSPLNEGEGRALRFGCYDSVVIDRLLWMATSVVSILDAACRDGDLDLTDLVAESLRRGDDAHGRTVAGRDLLISDLAERLVLSASPANDLATVLRWMRHNRHLFNTFAIVTAKAIADTAQALPGCPIVVAIASNGVELGIRMGHTGDRWFTCAAPHSKPKFFPGYSAADAAPVVGDSFIAEVAGLGAAAIMAAPAARQYFGISDAEARQLATQIAMVSAGASSRFLVPAADFDGTPLGIDVRRASAPAAPVVNNALVHREINKGQIGAGITTIPYRLLQKAAAELPPTVSISSESTDHGFDGSGG